VDHYYNLCTNFIIFFIIPKKSTKFKRLKKGRRSTEEEPSGLSDAEDFVGSGKVGLTAEEKLKNSLFGDDEGMFWLWRFMLLVFQWLYFIVFGRLLFTQIMEILTLKTTFDRKSLL